MRRNKGARRGASHTATVLSLDAYR
jgi:hypothetical protein